MDLNSTLDELAAFTQHEQELLAELELMESKAFAEQELQPKQSTIDNLLNYSKALSVRRSKNLGMVEVVLN